MTFSFEYKYWSIGAGRSSQAPEWWHKDTDTNQSIKTLVFTGSAMWWQGTMRRFSWQRCESNQRMAQYRAMGERNNNFSPSKERSNWWNLVLIKILIAVGRHPRRAVDPCIAHNHQLPCIYIQHRVDHCQWRKKIPIWPPTLVSWWVSITPYTRTTYFI